MALLQGDEVKCLNLTQAVVDAIFDIHYEDISQSAIQMARFVILDTLGSSLAATKTAIGKKYIDLCTEENYGTSNIWGTEKFTTLNMASFVNSFLAQILDYDDTYEINSLAVSHPGPAIIPLAITLGKKKNIEASELFRSIIVGYEMCMRFSKAIEPRDDMYFGFANSQIIGSVVAASIILGLNQEEFINAIGFAVSTSPIGNTKAMWSLDRRPMSCIKDGVGFVALTALMCSKMAQAGLTSFREGLDLESDYYKVCGSKKYKAENLICNLGNSYLIEEISFKAYPTCRFMQSTLDAVSHIIKRDNYKEHEISKIQVFMTPYLAKSFDIKSPQTIIDAEFSVPYAIAMIIAGREPSPTWYEMSTLEDPSIKLIMDKVEIIPDEIAETKRRENSELKTTVKVLLKSGNEIVTETPMPFGHPKNPFLPEDHEKKFSNMLSPYYQKNQINKIMDSILGINPTSNIKAIITSLNAIE